MMRDSPGRCHRKHWHFSEMALDKKKNVAEGLVYNVETAESMGSWRPHFCRVAMRYPHCTPSKVFLVSNAKMTVAIFSTIFRRLNSLLVPSEACLPLTNPTWSAFTNEGVILANLLAKMLGYIFRSVFNRDGSKILWSVQLLPWLGQGNNSGL